MNQHSSNNIVDDSTIQHIPETQMTNLASQTSPTKGTYSQNHVTTMEKQSRIQTGNEPVPFLSCSNGCLTDI